ncbi:hypothetical protein JRQ81_004378 [Phrynocephalus forsythii]|uniref:Ig-like domain-containing protein n=1 Tax=Phrynocephalus forsythii TaxID=171643 RepID=A0A9Q1AV01_9SAUR|nr:hypothetical protein JRQ81_004378 [Phrynocephalus forsythii]
MDAEHSLNHMSIDLHTLAALRPSLWKVSLTESGGGLKKPGETLRLTCTVNGYSLTDSSYATNWIRQPLGKGLEWIAIIWYDGSTAHNNALQNRATVTRDTSKSQVFLQLSTLKPEDSAVYYCARHTLNELLPVAAQKPSFLKGAMSHSMWLWSVVLTQGGSVLKAPRESVKLTCATSGFVLNDYYTAWIRQKPGEGLQWLVSYWKASASNYYLPAIQNRFTASKDSSNFYLQMNNLTPEDTAVYYCARDTVKETL